jgi:2-oxoglutarate ferredoxin oxidoreductase subunit alpha
MGHHRYGFTARPSLYQSNGCEKDGTRVGMLRLKTLWPFPEEVVRSVGKQVHKVIVPEMNRGQVAGEVKKACSCDVVSLGQTDGEIIRPEKIYEVLRRMS